MSSNRFNKLKRGVVIAASGIVVTGTTFLSNNITGISSLNISGITVLSGTVTTRSSLFVSGSTIMNNNVTLNSNLSVSGTATLTNATLGNTSTGTNVLVVNGQSNQMQIQTASTTGLASLYFTSPNGSAYMGVGSGSYSATNYANNMFIQSPSNMVFNVNGNGGSATPAMYIASNGNVGVGTTTPGTKMEVYTTGASSYLTIKGDTNQQQALSFTDSAQRWAIYKPSNTTDLMFWDGTADRITFKNGGNVGIGTTNPNYLLDVNGTIRGRSTNGLLLGTSTDTTRMISSLDSEMANNSIMYWALGKANSTYNQAEISYYHVADGSTSNHMSLGLFGIGVMTLLASGNVGIGTSSANANLHVNGTTILNGTVTTNSTLNVTGTLNANTTIINGAMTANTSIYINSSITNATSFNIYAAGETYSTTSSLKGTYNVAGTVATIQNSFVSSTTATLVDMGAYNTTNGNTNIYYGAVAGTSGNGPANFVIGRRTGVSTWTESMRIDTNGNVGIGTTEPTVKLDVRTENLNATSGTNINSTAHFIANQGASNVFTGTFGGYIQGGCNYGLNHYMTLGTVGWDNINNISTYQESIRMTGIGNVGIGTSSPSTTLHVSGNTLLTGNITSNGSLTLYNTGYDIGFAISTGNSTAYTSFESFNGANNVKKSLSFNPWGGNVGIGTTIPEGKLHIDGHTYIKNSSDWSIVKVIGTNPSWSSAYVATPTGAISGSNPEWFIGHRSDMHGPLSIWNYSGSHNGNVMTIGTNGNIGIGTSSPTSKLHIYTSAGTMYSTDAFTGQTLDNYMLKTTQDAAFNGDGSQIAQAASISLKAQDLYWTNNSLPGAEMIIEGGKSNRGETNGGGIMFKTSNSERMRISSNGNVGIGTTNASTLLTLYSSNSTTSFLSIFGPGGASGIAGINISPWAGTLRPGGTQTKIWAQDDGAYSAHLLFGTASGGVDTNPVTERMRLLSNGNLGIGTTAPNYRLDVSGDINFTGSLYQNGTVFVAGSGGSGGNINTNLVVTGNTTFNNPVSDSWQTTVGIRNNTSNATYQLLVGGSNNNTSAAGVGGFGIFGGLDGAADFRLNINSNGNVGIGTTNPSAKLHVEGATTILGTSTGASNLIINDITGAKWRIYTGGYALNFAKHTGTTNSDFSSWDQKMILDSNGNMGLGTNIPEYKIDIRSAGCGIMMKNTNASIRSSYAGYWSYNDVGKLYVGVDGPGFAEFANDSGLIGTWSNHHLLFATNATERIRITNEGNVGIGTNNPDNTLTVNGVIQMTDPSSSQKYAMYSDSSIWQLNPRTSTGQFNSIMGLSMDASGNVGVGTNTMFSKLHLAGSFFMSGTDFRINAGGDRGNSGMGRAFVHNSSNILTINYAGDFTGGTSVESRLMVTGNLGIGTTNPAQELHIVTSSGNTDIRIETTANAGQYIDIGTSPSNYHFIYGYAAVPMIFATNNAERIRITSDGNVGIGTTSPNTTLDVRGNIYAGGIYAVVNGATTSGYATLMPGGASNTGYIEFRNADTSRMGYIGFGSGSDFYFSIEQARNLLFNTNNVERMRITSGGYVGIGTSNPGALFQIASTGQDYTNSFSIKTAWPSIYLDGSNVSGGRNWSILNGGSGAGIGVGNFGIFDATASAYRFNINSSGYVGIGTESPTTLLDVSNSSDNYIRARVGSGTYSGIALTESSWYGHTIRYNQNDDSLRFSTQDNTPTFTDRMILTYGGSLGIGTMAPAYTLDVNGTFRNSGAGRICLQNSTDGGSSYGLYYWNLSDSNWVGYMGTSGSGRSASSGTACTGAFGFTQHAIRNRVATSTTQGFIWENNSETCLMSIRADGAGGGMIGSWGVNTLSPVYTLDVNGTCRIASGDNSKTYYGPNSSWGGALYVGAGTYNLAGATAQVIVTNGNLHLDCATGGRLTYINYYTSQIYYASAGVESYGTWNHHSGNLNVDNSIFGSSITGTQVYTNDWFRVNGNGGLWFESYGRGIRSPDAEGNDYGNITTHGTGRNGWSGYGLKTRYCFMINNSDAQWGIHDNSHSWIIKGEGGGNRDVTLGGGTVRCSRDWDMFVVYRNKYNFDAGYFFVNEAGGYGYASDARIKKDIEDIPYEKSIIFIKNLKPASFCIKDPTPIKQTSTDGKEEEFLPSYCNCREDGFIAQNVLESAKIAGVPKKVCNHWYDYEEEMKKPIQEQKIEQNNILGVNDRPILSHVVNVSKVLLDKVTKLETENNELKQKVINLETENQIMKNQLAQLITWAQTIGYN